MRTQMEQRGGSSAAPATAPLWRACARPRPDGGDALWLQGGPAGDACGIPQESHCVPWGARRCANQVHLGTRALPCRSGEQADEFSNLTRWLQGLGWLVSVQARRDCRERPRLMLLFSPPVLQGCISVTPL